MEKPDKTGRLEPVPNVDSLIEEEAALAPQIWRLFRHASPDAYVMPLLCKTLHPERSPDITGY